MRQRGRNPGGGRTPGGRFNVARIPANGETARKGRSPCTQRLPARARDAGERQAMCATREPGPRGFRSKSRNNSERRITPAKVRYRSDSEFQLMAKAHASCSEFSGLRPRFPGAHCEPVFTPKIASRPGLISDRRTRAGLKRHVRIGRPPRRGNREEEANKCGDFRSRLHRILLSPDEYCAACMPGLFKWCGSSWEKGGNCSNSGAPQKSIFGAATRGQRWKTCIIICDCT